MHRISAAVIFRDKAAGAGDWASYREMYAKGGGTAEEASANIIFSNVRAMLAHTVPKAIKSVVVSHDPKHIGQARVLQRVLDMCIEQACPLPIIRDVDLHAFIYGTGFFRTGFESLYGPAPDSADVKTGLGRILRWPGYGKKKDRVEYHRNVAPGWPWVEAWHPARTLIPNGSRRGRDLRWIVFQYQRSLADIKQDPRYSNTKGLKATRQDDLGSLNRVLMMDQEGELSESEKYVTLFEAHDRQTGKVVVLADGHMKPLLQRKDVLQVAGLPVVPMVFVENDMYAWGISEAYI